MSSANSADGLQNDTNQRIPTNLNVSQRAMLALRIQTSESGTLKGSPTMRTPTKILLAVTLVTSLQACAVVPAGPFYGGVVVGGPRPVVTVAPPPLIVAPAPVVVRPYGWGWGPRWGGYGYYRY